MTPDEIANLTKLGGGSAAVCTAVWMGGKIILALIQLIRDWREGDRQLNVRQSDLMVSMQTVLAAQDKKLERHYDLVDAQQKMDELRWTNLLAAMENMSDAIKKTGKGAS